MGNTSLDKGAGIGVSTADDRTVGTDSEAVDLYAVHTAVVILEIR